MPGELRTVVLDGHLTIETTVQGAQAIEKLQKQVTDSATAHDRAVADLRQQMEAKDGQIAALTSGHAKALEAKDGEIAGLKIQHQSELDAKNGELAALKAATSPQALDARVAARSVLIGQAKAVLGASFTGDGIGDADIRKQVVVKAMGASLVDADSRGPAFFDAAFDAVVAMAPKAGLAPAAPTNDSLATAIAAGAGAPVADAANQPSAAWQRSVDRMSTAWMGDRAKEPV